MDNNQRECTHGMTKKNADGTINCLGCGKLFNDYSHLTDSYWENYDANLEEALFWERAAEVINQG